MTRLNIDLQDDPEIPAGKELMERLVGAHMVARDEEELLHLVRHSIDAVYSTTQDDTIRILTHAAYRGQTLIVRLLDLATSQQIQLKDASIDHQGSPAQNSDRFTEQRLDLWTHLRDE